MADPQAGILALSKAKVQMLLMAASQVVAAANALVIDPGKFLEDEFVAIPAEQLDRAARIARWHSLHPVRELVRTVATALRDAAIRLEAAYARYEDQLCALDEEVEPSRIRTATPAKA